MDGFGNEMSDNPKFDGQVWTCMTPLWPEQECKQAKPSFRKNGKCMYLHENEDNRCDNIKNTQKEE